MGIKYVLMRLLRRLLPSRVFRFFLRRNILVKPGQETNDPVKAADYYCKLLENEGISLRGKRILNFGFGGYFGVAVELLKKGAGHVYLYDKYAALDQAKNLELSKKNPEFIIKKGDKLIADPQYITYIQKDIDSYLKATSPLRVDLIISSSVLEHTRNTEEVIDIFKKTTDFSGTNIHIIDLRDHYFKYPFGMLCYSDKMWERFLNPDSHLNRLRAIDYRRLFEANFRLVKIKVTAADAYNFGKIKNKIKAKFISGDEHLDAATNIVLIAKEPIN